MKFGQCTKFPDSKGDVFKLLVLSDKQSKTQFIIIKNIEEQQVDTYDKLEQVNLSYFCLKNNFLTMNRLSKLMIKIDAGFLSLINWLITSVLD